MFKSLKSKLVILIASLIIFVLSITSFMLLSEKKQELTRDIYLRGKAYAELSTQEIVNDYNDLLKEGGFVLFTSRIQELFALNDDITRIRIATFEGKLLYDSETEQFEMYQGQERIIKDALLLERIQSKNTSLDTDHNRTVYLKKIDNIDYTVDANEKIISEVGDNERINTLVVPHTDSTAVIFSLSYDLLDARIAQTQKRIILLIAFALMIGLAVAIVSAGTVTAPLRALKEAVGIIAKGDFNKRVTIKSRDEVGSLAESVNSMAADLELSTKALVYKERVAKELELATKLQSQILPDVLPTCPGIDIGAGLLAAAEVGGDLYDFLQIEEKKLISYIGDVTGHGVASGILGSIANALIYGFAGRADIKEITAEANRIIHAKSTQNMFLTMVMTEWNADTKEFSYVSAGHEQIVYYHKDTDSIEMLPSGGLALGMIPNIADKIEATVLKPQPGDIAVIYTDGIPEARCNATDLYGFERFQKVVKSFANLETAEAIKNAIIADVRHYIGSYEQLDDITLIVYKWV